MVEDEYVAELKLLYEKAKELNRFHDAIDILQEIWSHSSEDEKKKESEE